MAKVRARMSSKGQLTIPKAVRDRLGLCEGSTVEIEVNGHSATIRPVDEGILSLLGTFRAKQPVTDWNDVRDEVAEEVGRRAAEGTR